MGFGRKNQWIATKCGTAKELANALQLEQIRTANWQSGLAAAYGYPKALVFVTPPLGGWVLAVGGLPDPCDPPGLACWRRLMTQVSLRFGEAQFFATHRVSNYTAWARYFNGEENRLFAQADEPIYNLGKAFPDEAELVSQFFDPTSPDATKTGYWSREDLRFPEEDDVFAVARLWSVDPLELESSDFPPSLGLVGDAPK